MSEFKPWLVFRHPVFKEGQNATVRLGTKTGIRIGPEQIIEIREWNSQNGTSDYLFDAFVNDSKMVRICDITERMLEDMANPSARTAHGLIEDLKRLYPRATINGRTKVTLVLFEQCEPDPGEHDEPIVARRTH